MIEAVELEKRFGEVRAVRSVSFEALDGQVTGLLGPNGAGKTTTLRMLYGLIEADAGRVIVDGQDVGKSPLAARARMGVLPDAQGLYPRLTAREHVRYFGQLHGLRGKELDERVDTLIDALDTVGNTGAVAAGAGKSTLLSVLFSLGPLNAGSVSIGKLVVSKFPVAITA